MIVVFVDVQGIAINDTRLGSIYHDGISLPDPQQGGAVGIVEVFMDQYDTWLPVCSTTSWDSSAESKVLCRQLGFNTTLDPGIYHNQGSVQGLSSKGVGGGL